MKPGVSIGKLLTSLIDKATGRYLLSVSKPHVVDTLIIKRLQTTSSNELKAYALPFAGRGCHGGKQPFIWVLGKNRFIRVAASVA